MPVALKRVYDPPKPADGARVLVDRLWPRGISKDSARLTAWLKELAPSNELRQWYHARPTLWKQFRDRYLEELREPQAAAALQQLYDLVNVRKRVTLLFGSRNLERNNATVLKELLEGTKKPPSSSGPAGAGAVAVRKRAAK